MTSERYTHGHDPAVRAAHSARTAADSAGFLLPHLSSGLRLLDVGCGPGSISTDLAELVAPGKVVGVDASLDVLEYARNLAASREVDNVVFQQSDAYHLGFDDNSFDVVYSHQVLQHLARPVEALIEFKRVLRRGGLLAVRDADYGTMVHAPFDPRIQRWLELYHVVACSNGGEPDAGRLLRRWVLEAGFDELSTSAAAWCYADPLTTRTWAHQWASRVTEGAFADAAIRTGAAHKDELYELANAWIGWAEQPAAFFAFLHGEVLARKP